MKDEIKQTNPTFAKNKVLVRMESAVSSVTSTQELFENTTTAKAGKLKAMISQCSRRMLLVIICLLSIGILTITTLYVLEYHKMKQIITKVKESKVIPNCLEYPSGIVLEKMPVELSTLLPSLEADIMSTAQTIGVKAASFGIAYQGKMWWTFNFGRVNFTDPKSTAPSSNTPYPVASLTKLLTAVMLMKLIENGAIKSLDDPIDKYDPGFKVKNPFNSDQITFRNLLCMTSGLPRESPCNPPLPYNFCPYNSTEMWKRIANIELQLRPNLTPVYSNLGYAVLGRVMESVLNGTTYEDYLKRELFDNLGLTNSGFNLRQRKNDFPLSTDFDHQISKIIDWGWLSPAGGYYTTLNELNKFVSVMLEGLNATFIRKTSKRRLFSQEYENGLGCPFSLFKVNEKIENKQFHERHYTFNGLTVGYVAEIGVSPENTLATYGLFAHGGDYMHALRLNHKIRESVFAAVSKALRNRKQKYKIPGKMEAYLGSYKLTSYWPLIANNAIISEQNGRLSIKLDWFAADLAYVSPWKLKLVAPNNNYCEDIVTQTGLLNNILHFTEPPKGTVKSPGFYTTSISAFGYASFSRV